jgi:hypothetical protein
MSENPYRTAPQDLSRREVRWDIDMRLWKEKFIATEERSRKRAEGRSEFLKAARPAFGKPA